MTTMNPAPSTRPSAPPRRMTVAEYEDLIESRVIDERAPVELIEGRVVGKMRKGTRHCVASDCVQQALTAALPPGSGWFIRVEKPVALPGRNSMPEPDVAIIRGGPRDYLPAQPRPEHAGLVVEIADTSLSEDRRRMELYLACGIPACWLLNLVDERLEVHRLGATPEVLGGTDSVELILDARPVARIAVAHLLPGRIPG